MPGPSPSRAASRSLRRPSPRRASTRAARAVFVEQEDVFCPELTAREHLRFRAGLALWRRDRSRAANAKEADRRAEELLETFGLETVADHPRVGAPADARALGGARGLSGGERKRLAVALEVVGAPRIVFADEPTSGLDSQLAASVVRTLARLAKGGAVVVFSIHQPSQRCFDLCDDLVVLAHGKTLYTGPAADAVRTWRRKDGALLRTMRGHNAVLNACDVNSAGVLATAGDDGSLRLWDYRTGYNFQRLETVAQPGSLACEAGIYDCAFDRSGTRLITCEADKTVKIWKEQAEADPESHPIDMESWTKECRRRR